MDAKRTILDKMTPPQRVRFAIYCAQASVSTDTGCQWHEWADKWLTRQSRSSKAARHAEQIAGKAREWAANRAFEDETWPAAGLWGSRSARAGWDAAKEAARAAKTSSAEVAYAAVMTAVKEALFVNPGLAIGTLAHEAVRDEP